MNGDPRPAPLCCGICLYSGTDLAEDAVTIIRGTAVCMDHVGIAAQGTEWQAMVNAARP